VGLWDNRGTSAYESDFFDFDRLRRLDPGSIPAAATNDSLILRDSVLGFSAPHLARASSRAKNISQRRERFTQSLAESFAASRPWLLRS